MGAGGKKIISCGSPVELKLFSKPVTADEGLHILRTKVGSLCILVWFCCIYKLLVEEWPDSFPSNQSLKVLKEEQRDTWR